MQPTVKQLTKAPTFSLNWKKEEDVFTGDHLIDAYLIGKEDGKNERIKILSQQFEINLDTATSVSEKLFEEVSKKNITIKTIHLKADGLTKFSALFIADEKDFLSDKFREAYLSARRIKNEVESENFYISFSFMSDSISLNEKCIYADGFFLKYEKK